KNAQAGILASTAPNVTPGNSQDRLAAAWLFLGVTLGAVLARIPAWAFLPGWVNADTAEVSVCISLAWVYRCDMAVMDAVKFSATSGSRLFSNTSTWSPRHGPVIR